MPVVTFDRSATAKVATPQGAPQGVPGADALSGLTVCETPGARASEAAKRGLAYTPAVKAETDHLYERVKHVVTPMEWPAFAPLIAGINRLKKERGAVILAHNYMTAEIFNCVGDFRGDSLGLAREAAKVDADVIVQGGVHFMAETSKILSPHKIVLIPDLRAGCSLAASITGEDVRLIKQKYPGIPVVTYVNTTADVKAESDICCTSSNAMQVVETIARDWGVDRVIMLPDEYLAKNVAAQTGIKIISWKGKCEVHERFTAADIAEIRAGHPDAIVLAHPECPPDVVAASDFTGSTGAMSDYVRDLKPKKVVLITECSMSDNVAVANPEVTFVKPCNLCPHMKVITLEAIYDALLHMRHEVQVDPEVAARAKKAVDAMLALPPAPAGVFDPSRPVPASLELI
jgi:quinolinate synthase